MTKISKIRNEKKVTTDVINSKDHNRLLQEAIYWTIQKKLKQEEKRKDKQNNLAY